MSAWQGLFAFAVSVGVITQPTAQAQKVEVTRSQWLPNGLYSYQGHQKTTHFILWVFLEEQPNQAQKVLLALYEHTNNLLSAVKIVRCLYY